MTTDMRKEDLKIVFFGTPDFAVESLKRLVDGGYNVVAVVTMPDKPAGRGRQLQQSDVKRFAVERGLPVLQPVSLKDEAFLDELKALEAQLFIVIAFRMLPEAVWQMPPLGTFNLHASLLPRYRGAAPINWAVMNGDTETGVTTFFLKHEIDTGDVIQQRSCPIGRHDDVETVHDRLMVMGADMVVETVDAIIDDGGKGICTVGIGNKTEVFGKLFKILEGHSHCHNTWTNTTVVGNPITYYNARCGIHYEPDEALNTADFYIGLIGGKSRSFFVRVFINERLHANGGSFAVVGDHLM